MLKENPFKITTPEDIKIAETLLNLEKEKNV